MMRPTNCIKALKGPHSFTLPVNDGKSLDQGIIPMDWRIANVSPIFKKGSRGKASNYRPVSLTSQVCKIYESILRDAIVEHLINNQLIRDSQHGFLRGRSCLSNLLAFLDKVTDYVDKGINAVSYTHSEPTRPY